MQDLTIKQALRKLRKIFPDKSCYTKIELWEHAHLLVHEQPNPTKVLYIDGYTHIEGKNFRHLLKLAQELKDNEAE